MDIDTIRMKIQEELELSYDEKMFVVNLLESSPSAKTKYINVPLPREDVEWFSKRMDIHSNTGSREYRLDAACRQRLECDHE